MTVDNLFKLIKGRASKSGYIGTICSADFNLYVPQAELRYYLKLYGNQNRYQAGNPIPPIAYPETIKVSTSLSKFTSAPTAISIDGAGKYTKVAGTFFVDSISHVPVGLSIPVPIKRVEHHELNAHLVSAYDYPTEMFPIYTEYDTYLQFYPITLATGSLTYLKAPTVTKWASTINGTIATTNTLVGGSGYVNGVYPNVALTGGVGNKAIATITVAGGVVTVVAITNGGFSYKTTDSLTTANTFLGGTGAGFTVLVATIINGRETYDPSNSVHPQWADFDMDEIIYLTLMDIGIFLKDGELEQFANAQTKTGGI